MKQIVKSLCLMLVLSTLASVSALATDTTVSGSEPEDNCTAIYIGSQVSTDGTTIIARCADTHPTTVSCYLNITEASDEPGRIVTGKNGFSYTLPDSTYKYWSLPRPAALEKGNSWDSVAANEKGVAVSATVTGYVCEAALAADPYVADGITEDNIAGLIAACADSSRHAVELIAEIIDAHGSGESNMFLVADTEECWYMEIYTGHQYAAVKLPADCVAGFGNEFMLDGLNGFEEVLCSPELEQLPEVAGFAQYNSDGSLNLFDTYAGKGRLADYANLRTWRIHAILAPSTAGEYDTQTKYDFLYYPDEKVSTADVIDIFRDRMEGTAYEDLISTGTVRVIGTETASQVHVLKVHKDLPAEIAVEGWLCLSNANYAPFVPISNAVTSAISEYTYIMPSYRLDKNAAYCVYKELNALAAQNRTQYGLGIEDMWQEYESIWEAEFTDILNQAADLYEHDKTREAAELLTDACESFQRQAIAQAEQTTDDLLWYMMETTDTLKYSFSYETLTYAEKPDEVSAFIPMISAEEYASVYGWESELSEGKLILTDGTDNLTIVPSDGKRTSTGEILINGESIPVKAENRNSTVYVSLDTGMEYLKKSSVSAES